MDYEDNGIDYTERSNVKAKATWFSAQDVCILSDLVRSHSDALRNLSNSPSRNEKRKVWEVIAQLLAEKTNVPRTTRQVQKKWSNLRSAVRRAARTNVGTAVLPHYFLPVVKYLEEEENALDVCVSQEVPEEDDDTPQNVDEPPQTRRSTYAVKIRQIQEQEAEVERFTVLKQIKIEACETSEDHQEREIPETAEVQEELQFAHVTLPSVGNIHSGIEQPNVTAPIWINEGCENLDTGAEQSESDDFQTRQGVTKRNLRGTRKRSRPWPENWEEKTDEEEARQMKLELLKAQLFLVQKETSLKEREIVKKDKEISLLDKEILKIDLEIKFMKRKHMWEELKMGNMKK